MLNDETCHSEDANEKGLSEEQILLGKQPMQKNSRTQPDCAAESCAWRNKYVEDAHAAFV
jgi:hypothetical protein